MGTDPVWWIIPAAFFLDMVLGDPLFLPHPIRFMGKAIEELEPVYRRIPVNPVISGGLFALSLIGLTWLIFFLVIRAAMAVSPVPGRIIQVVLVYYCISTRSLEQAAMKVYRALLGKGIEAARERLKMIVGRQVEDLSENQISRAAVETVAENLVDGVVSPLFFAAIGGAPLAMAYKMINTLDSMVGYKNDKYLLFGKVSARIDDAANFIPARLSIPMISLGAFLLNGRGKTAFKTAVKEGGEHTSPNAGLSEAAFAGSLNIRLGGPGSYHGKRVVKPFIGKGFKKAMPHHIKQACDLMQVSALLCMVFLWGAGLIL